MTKLQATQWKTICWIAVGGFTAASAWFGWELHQMASEAARPGAVALMCGNSITDPLGAILSCGTPIGAAAVVGLARLTHHKFASRWPVLIAAGIVIDGTPRLLVFGIEFFRDSLPNLHLSQIVWWLKPFGVWG